MNDKSASIERAKKVKLIALDIDGVLTDGFIYFSTDDVEIKRFSFRDIMAISQLKKTKRLLC